MGYAITRDEIIAVVNDIIPGDSRGDYIAGPLVDVLITKIREKDPCYGKAMLDGQPIFTLLAKDEWAPSTILHWCELRTRALKDTTGAHEVAAQMTVWRAQHSGKRIGSD